MAAVRLHLHPPRKAISPFGHGPTIRLAPVAPIMGMRGRDRDKFICGETVQRADVERVEQARHRDIRTAARIKASDHLRRPRQAWRRPAYADSLTERLSIPSEIKMPDQPGDWNDVLVRG